MSLDANAYHWLDLSDAPQAAWIRLQADRDVAALTALFHFSNTYQPAGAADRMGAIALPEATDYSAGLVRARGTEPSTLQFSAQRVRDGKVIHRGYYEMDVDMRLRRMDDLVADRWLQENVAVPEDVIQWDDASILFHDEDGTRYRLPVAATGLREHGPLGSVRIDREVCTERDLFNCGGLFYELPARNAGGFSKIRPITAHGRRVFDYCSWRGLMVVTGIDSAADDHHHLIRADDVSDILGRGN